MCDTIETYAGKPMKMAEPVRERTAREALEREAKNFVAMAVAIHAKIEILEKELGKAALEVPESEFRRKFSLDFYGPF